MYVTIPPNTNWFWKHMSHPLWDTLGGTKHSQRYANCGGGQEYMTLWRKWWRDVICAKKSEWSWKKMKEYIEGWKQLTHRKWWPSTSSQGSHQPTEQETQRVVLFATDFRGWYMWCHVKTTPQCKGNSRHGHPNGVCATWLPQNDRVWQRNTVWLCPLERFMGSTTNKNSPRHNTSPTDQWAD